jgi:hypothetical protein
MGGLTLAAVLTSFSLASLEATPLLCSSLDVCYEVRQSEICEDPSFGYWLKPLRQLAGCGDDTNWRAFKIFDQRGCGRLFFNGLGGAIWTTNSWAFRHFHRLDEYRYRRCGAARVANSTIQRLQLSSQTRRISRPIGEPRNWTGRSAGSPNAFRMRFRSSNSRSASSRCSSARCSCSRCSSGR